MKPTIERPLLAFGAHPDDIEFFMAGASAVQVGTALLHAGLLQHAERQMRTRPVSGQFFLDAHMMPFGIEFQVERATRRPVVDTHVDR